MPNYIQRITATFNEECPGLEDELVQLYVLLALTKGTDTTLGDVHDAWALWRNVTAPGHKSLVAFGELSREVQDLDSEYQKAIHRTAKRYQGGDDEQ
jgi:hypothetical protein